MATSTSFKTYTLGPNDLAGYKRYIADHLVPPLAPSAYKGQMGRVGVVGGSPDYTGAPYYAAQSALKFGADLSFVVCAQEAAVPIKAYSPELMVTPFYEEDAVVHAAAAAADTNETAGGASSSSTATCTSSSSSSVASLEALAQRMADKVAAFLPRLHALVIGPGLGRDPVVLRAVALLIARARESALPLVVDADGLWLVAQDLGTVRGYARCVLTPNAVEFDRLLAAAGVAAGGDDAAAVHALSVALGGVTVVKKGAVDVVSAGAGAVFLVAEPGSMRRCGGQGDILAGTLGVAVHWAGAGARAGAGDGADAAAAAVLAALPSASVGGGTAEDASRNGSGGVPHTMWAAALASAVTKRASARAFSKHERAMTSPDVLLEIGPSFQDFCRGGAQ